MRWIVLFVAVLILLVALTATVAAQAQWVKGKTAPSGKFAPMPGPTTYRAGGSSTHRAQ